MSGNHAPGARGQGALDIEHLARLANLPLDEAETDALEAACAHVLEAFGLPEAEGEVPLGPPVRLFEDVPRAWDPEGIEAILAAMPQRDGRHLIP